MAPTIRVDEEVFKALQKLAEPFVDSPNDVLRRILGLNNSSPRPERQYRSPAERATPDRVYRPLILRALVKTGGSAPVREVLSSIKQAMNGSFKPRDLEQRANGEIIWENAAKWERKHMVIEGLLKSNSPRGIWELTEKGWQEARKQT